MLKKTENESQNARSHFPKRQAALVSFISCAVVAALFYQLNGVLNVKATRNENSKPIATLKQSFKIVQRKYNRQVMWGAVNTDETLYSKDSVRTDAESQATITFDDGTVLDLGENSLVILDRTNEKLGIEFLKGTVSAKSENANVEIKTASGQLKLSKDSKSDVALSSGTNGDVEVTVSKGNAKIETATGSVDLKENERALSGAQGVTKEALTLLMTVPEPGARAVVDDDGKTALIPIVLKRLSNTEKVSLVLEVSPSKTFAQITQSVAVEFAENAVDFRKEIRLGPGVHSLRVKAPGGDDLQGIKISARSLTVESRDNYVLGDLPSQIEIKDGTPLSISLKAIRKRATTSKVKFEITDLATKQPTILAATQVQDAAGQDSGSKSAVFSVLAPGTYSIRMIEEWSALSKATLKAYSQPKKLVVYKDVKPVTPVSIAVATPENGKVITVYEKKTAIEFAYKVSLSSYKPEEMALKLALSRDAGLASGVSFFEGDTSKEIKRIELSRPEVGQTPVQEKWFYRFELVLKKDLKKVAETAILNFTLNHLPELTPPVLASSKTGKSFVKDFAAVDLKGTSKELGDSTFTLSLLKDGALLKTYGPVAKGSDFSAGEKLDAGKYIFKGEVKDSLGRMAATEVAFELTAIKKIKAPKLSLSVEAEEEVRIAPIKMRQPANDVKPGGGE